MTPFFICAAVAAVAGMATAEPGAFISQREVTNADVFQQKQRLQQDDAYNGQSQFQAGNLPIDRSLCCKCCVHHFGSLNA